MKINICDFFENLFTEKCKHENKTEIFNDYQDRCIQCVCDDCGETVLIGMDD